MLQDRLNAFSLSQDLGGVAFATINGTDVYDNLIAGKNIGNPAGNLFRLACEETMTSGGSSTLNLQLVTSAASTLTTPTVLWETGALAYNHADHLTLGEEFEMWMPPRTDYLQYTGVLFVVGTANLTAGIFSAKLVLNTEQHPIHASGMNFSGL